MQYLQQADDIRSNRETDTSVGKAARAKTSSSVLGLPVWALDALEAHENYQPLEPDKRNGNEFWKLLVRKLENALLITNWAEKDVEMLDRAHRTALQPHSNSCISKLLTRDPEGESRLQSLALLLSLIHI